MPYAALTDAPSKDPLNRAQLWIVSAPSGAGKTSLTRAVIPLLAARDLVGTISVSYTTRAPRAGEQDGVHYHFVDESTFLAMIERGEFLEHAEVFGRRYGTGRNETRRLLTSGQDVFLDIDWQGARQVRAKVEEAQGIFILPPSSEELERRLSGRGQDAPAVIAERMRQARAELSHWSEYDYLIINDDFDRALEELAAIIRARHLQRPLQQLRHQAFIDRLLAS